ncbi:phage tail protein [Ferrimonas sp. SCSIO 43195]|uniref:phage tail protein n=1 Tax=Ferrimonas sp. SCSIO 43195 TaxID=2822844 RepID=UPI0020750842|nr:tail fiber protein [Ferrimonas sp. SCSIO 43195]USD39153.1 phage tail protein [Ferrimonas sp. SCSIO 43195]
MSEPFIGEIKMVGFTFAPRGWAFCNGQIMAIAQNTALFSLLGTTYGGDGRTSFGLPEMRGRVPVHCGGTSGTGPGLPTWRLGERAGSTTHRLNVLELPSHNHQIQGNNVAFTGTANIEPPASNESANQGTPKGNVPAIIGTTDRPTKAYSDAPDAAMKAFPATVSGTAALTGQTLLTGGSQAFSIMQPSIAMNYVIALMGIFPSRN